MLITDGTNFKVRELSQKDFIWYLQKFSTMYLLMVVNIFTRVA